MITKECEGREKLYASASPKAPTTPELGHADMLSAKHPLPTADQLPATLLHVIHRLGFKAAQHSRITV